VLTPGDKYYFLPYVCDNAGNCEDPVSYTITIATPAPVPQSTGGSIGGGGGGYVGGGSGITTTKASTEATETVGETTGSETGIEEQASGTSQEEIEDTGEITDDTQVKITPLTGLFLGLNTFEWLTAVLVGIVAATLLIFALKSKKKRK
jgi:hypothetical protein